MLKHEFEERIGRKVTDEEYNEAKALYASLSWKDKDRFCKFYIEENGILTIALDLATQVKGLNIILDEKSTYIEDIGKNLVQISQNLHKAKHRSEVWDEIDALAMEILDDRDFLKVKLQKGYPLTERDKKKLIEIL